MRFFWAAVFLIACTSVEKKPTTTVNIGEEATLVLPQPKDILPSVELTQLLSFEYNKNKKSIQTVLSSSSTKLTLIGLLPFGGEAFRVEYDGNEITSQQMSGAPNFDLKMALADIVLVYADTDRLTEWLSTNSKVNEQKNERTVIHKGQSIIKIRYDRNDKLAATVDYHHLLRGYKIHIQPISQIDNRKAL